jgi:ABC-type multidrug transport system ATPase subunit
MRLPRVAPADRVELHLLPPFVKNATTDAEMRAYLNDLLVNRTQDDFRHLNLDADALKPFAVEALKRIRLEFDVNIERVQTEESPFLDYDRFGKRYQMLGFKFQRFLDSLRQVEDEEIAAAQREAQTIASANQAAARLGSGEFSSLEQGKTVLPVDLVGHMFKVGIEAHLQLVRKLVFGDYFVGVSLTFKDLKVAQARVGQVNPTNPGATHALHALSPGGPRTVWSETLRIMCGCCVKAVQSMYESEDESFDVLKNLNGAIEPGRVGCAWCESVVTDPVQATLLLGPPHAGKTSLFHALSGRTTKSRRYSGEVFYNGHSNKEVHPPNFVTVVDQTDLHIPSLTVRETLEFAYHCRGKMSKEAMLVTDDPAAARNIAKNRVNLVMATLGLLRVADTPIGNEFIKGVSGGEMRRVTLGEMLVMGAQVLLLDEISTGLDSAATLDISKAIRALCRVFDLTVVVSLLQPPPETYEVFDDVLLMVGCVRARGADATRRAPATFCASRVCSIAAPVALTPARADHSYHGPRRDILPFFASLGLARPVEVDVADFLVDAAFAQPDKLLDGFRTTPGYAKTLGLATADPATLQTDHPMENRLIHASRYKRSLLSLLRVVTVRQWQIISRNTAFLKARVMQNVVMGLMLGALFFSVPFVQWYLISMVILQVLAFTSFGTLANLADVVAVRNVYYKQARENFFPPASYVLADYLVDLPFGCFDGFLLGSIVYFMAGLSITNNAEPYFVFLVIAISYNVCMAQVIRFFAYAAPDSTMAAAFSVLFLVMGIMFSGAVRWGGARSGRAGGLTRGRTQVATPLVIPPCATAPVLAHLTRAAQGSSGSTGPSPPWRGRTAARCRTSS